MAAATVVLLLIGRRSLMPQVGIRQLLSVVRSRASATRQQVHLRDPQRWTRPSGAPSTRPSTRSWASSRCLRPHPWPPSFLPSCEAADSDQEAHSCGCGAERSALRLRQDPLPPPLNRLQRLVPHARFITRAQTVIAAHSVAPPYAGRKLALLACCAALNAALALALSQSRQVCSANVPCARITVCSVIKLHESDAIY